MRMLAKKRAIKSATLEAMKTFGFRVRKERDREGLTLEEMSERVGLEDWKSFQRIELHCSNIPLSMVIDIARELGVEVGDLFRAAAHDASRSAKRPVKKRPKVGR